MEHVRRLGHTAIIIAALISGSAPISVASAAGAASVDFVALPTPHLEEQETHFLRFDQWESYACLGDGWLDHRENLWLQDRPDKPHYEYYLCAGSLMAELHVTVLKPRDLVLTIEMRQNFFPRLNGQKVDILWNGHLLGACAFTNDNGWDTLPFPFDVPQGVQQVGKNTVRFVSRYVVARSDVRRDEKRGRPLAFALASLRLDDPPYAPVEDSTTLTPDHQRPKSIWADGRISQPGRTRLRVPLDLPEAERAVFTFDVPPETPLPGGAQVLLQYDTPDGLREETLVPPGVSTKVEADLSAHAGDIIEIILDASMVDPSSAALWKCPRVILDGAIDAAAAAPPDAPAVPLPNDLNVVLVILDALRADALGCYGYLRPTSPNIDALAAEGIRFDRVYSAAPYTTSSTWSLLTSLYPCQHGATTGGRRVNEAVPRLHALLKQAGIATGLASANFHLDPKRAARIGEGFDEYFEAYDTLDMLKRQAPRAPGALTEHVVDFLTRRKDQRFFLYAHYMVPHDPYFPNPPYAHSFSIEPVKPVDTSSSFLMPVNWHERPLPPNDLYQIRARYDESILEADAEIGRIRQTIGDLGLAAKTVIIVASDHGEAFMEHGRLGHTWRVYDEFIRIPLILGGEPIKALLPYTFDGIVRNIDLFPTICDLLSVAVPETCVGSSLLRQRSNRAHDQVLHYALAEYPRNPLEAYLWLRYKLIRSEINDTIEVYDRLLDPGERLNLAEMRPVFADYLLAQGLAWKTRQVSTKQFAFTEDAGEEPLSEEDAARLKALGYL
ncbi:MAG TPA: sulfatase [Candidatus Hydrogenedentes bacterium]|nr:sulfatase [Candidatus Hydrogenedentota bacterium]HPG69038.1 sulfatase [Candidatus Hydrogenedentota bacterium]